MVETDPPPEERAALESLMRSLREAGPPPKVRDADAGATALPSDLIEGFTLLEELGQGGQGVVFRARQAETGRDVALKILRQGPLLDARALHRFKREIELVAALQHPHVVTIHGAGRTAEGHAWVAMELLEGPTLRTYLEQETPDFATRLRLFRQVTAAIAAAHRLGIIHLDLKPSNVLLDAAGAVRVVDFGLARSVLEDVGTLSLEDLGGTPGFMAPEQVRDGLAGCDTRTDIHGLGALLVFLFTGQAPYAASTSAFSQLEAIAAGKRIDLATAFATLPAATLPARHRADLLAICRQALALDPEARYPSLTALQSDLEAMATGDVVSARAGERRYRLRRALRQSRLPLLLVTAATVVTWFAIDLARKEAEEARLAERRFDLAQEAASAFLSEVDPLLKDLPGAGPARERIIARGLEFLDRLLATAPEDPRLRYTAAKGLLHVAQVQGDVYTSSSGRLAEATLTLGRLQQVLPDGDLVEEVLAEFARPARVVRMQGHLLAARVAREMGEQEQQEVQLMAVFALEAPSIADDFEGQRCLSSAWEELGRLQLGSGRTEAGRASLRRSRESLTALADDPTRTAQQRGFLRRDVAVLLLHEATVAEGEGDLETARDYTRRFLDDAAARLEEDPDQVVALRDLAAGKERLSRIEAKLGNAQASMDAIVEARDLQLRIRARNPEHPSIWASQISATNRIGERHLAAGDLDEAEAWFRRFEEEAVAFTVAFPEHPRAHRMLGVAYYKFCEVAMARGAAAGARGEVPRQREALTSALAHLDRALAHFQARAAEGLLAEADLGIPAALEEERQALARTLEDLP